MSPPRPYKPPYPPYDPTANPLLTPTQYDLALHNTMAENREMMMGRKVEMDGIIAAAQAESKRRRAVLFRKKAREYWEGVSRGRVRGFRGVVEGGFEGGWEELGVEHPLKIIWIIMGGEGEVEGKWSGIRMESVAMAKFLFEKVYLDAKMEIPGFLDELARMHMEWQENIDFSAVAEKLKAEVKKELGYVSLH